MAKSKFPTIPAAGKQRVLNVRPDPPDIRDRMYEPALVQLQPEIDHRRGCVVLDQGNEGACTGFGLAAAINLLNRTRRDQPSLSSPRMLYEMAKKHDEWPGEDYAGSSCRGAIRGWKNMGVCSSKEWPFIANRPGALTIERAKAARACVLGAYYRLRPELNDYHVALNEVGAIFVSADVHGGWYTPTPLRKNGLAVIKPATEKDGGHAFALVGYNAQGFIVQNSWGKKWGSQGFAIWLYEDWLANINDGWVFRLAIPTPALFGLTSRTGVKKGAEAVKPAPKRLEIAGHFVHFDDGTFKARGNYWSTGDDLKNTATRLRQSALAGKYDHLLIYAHGGLNSPDDSARRVAALKDGFLRNRIYPFHVMYDTGLVEEVKDAVVRAVTRIPSEGFLSDILDQLIEKKDLLIEDIVRKPVTPIWDEMKRDARLPFRVDSAGRESDGMFVIRTFAEALAGTSVRIHLAGHSTGAVLLGHLLRALDVLGMGELIRSCSLLAPACSLDFYQDNYAPRLGRPASGVALPALDIYNLNAKLELDDNVAAIYQKSLLFLVSRALERQIDKPLLGMARYAEGLAANPHLTIRYSDGKNGVTTSTSHGGFDNDVNTMNAILRRVLGHEAEQPFLPGEMKGY